MKRVMLAVGISILVLTACKKENVGGLVQQENADYEFPQEEGIYWVYNWYSVDSNGVEMSLNQVDSVFILGDTVINGNTYAIYKGNFMGSDYFNSYLRDSSGFIVDQHGNVSFTYVDFNTIYNSGSEPGFWDYYGRYLEGTFNVSVPAGAFETIAAEYYVYSPDGSSINACDDTEYSFKTHYVSGIGEVQKETAFFGEFQSACKKRVRRLVDYYIP